MEQRAVKFNCCAPHCRPPDPEERPFGRVSKDDRLDGSRRAKTRTSPCGSACFALNGKLEGVAVALDVPRAEMSADHQGRGIGETAEQFAPRHR